MIARAIASPRPVPSRSRAPGAAVEALEQMRGLVRGDPGAVVDHLEADAVADRGRGDLDRSALGRVGDRVVDQVAEHLGEPVGVGHQGPAELGDPVFAAPHQRQVATQVGQQVREVDRLGLHRRSGVLARQRQHLCDQPLHPTQLPAHDVEALAPGVIGLAAQQVELAARDRDRGPQLVRGVGDELALALEGALEAVEHPVERVGEAADLGRATVDLEPPVELAGLDLGGEPGHPHERARDQGRDPDRDPEQDHEGDRAGGEEGAAQTVLRGVDLRERLGDAEGPERSIAGDDGLREDADPVVAPGAHGREPGRRGEQPAGGRWRVGPGRLVGLAAGLAAALLGLDQLLAVRDDVAAVVDLDREDPRVRVVGLAVDEPP